MNWDSPLDAAALQLAAEEALPLRAKWLFGIALMALTASLFLVEALYAAMDRNLRFAVAPAFFDDRAGTAVAVAGGLGDRISTEGPARSPLQNGIKVEQLDSSGQTVRHFTHVVAVLAELAPAPDREDLEASIQDASALPPPRGDLPVGAATAAVAPAVIPVEPGPIGDAINVTPVFESAPSPPPKQRVVVARGGDDLARVLAALGVSSAQAAAVATVYGNTGGRVFAGGEKIVVVFDAAASNGDAAGPMRIDVERDGAAVWSAARTDEGGYAPVAKTRTLDPTPAPVVTANADLLQNADEKLVDSLYGLVQARGVDRSLVDQIVRLCAHDFDLDSPVAGSDRVEFLSTVGDADQPELRFVNLTAQGKTRSYYRFAATDDGGVDYYDRDGRSVTKFLLRNPVPGGRLNDGFGWRIHPILKIARFHEGVDYDAPLGSRVEAAGGGVVEKIDQETGYGKYIRIRHDLGYETTYAHVAGVARGIKVGARVRQGEVIAYVGSTGYSTGPHLYYEVKINGHNVDPLKIRLSDGRILSGSALALFRTRRDRTDRLLEASQVADGAPAPGG